MIPDAGTSKTGIRRFLGAVLLISLSLLGCTAGVQMAAHDSPGDVPDDLRVNGPQVAMVHATGFQIYTCTADAAGKLSWVLKGPDATFESANGLKGRHFADGGPTWQAADGSKVIGRRLKEHASPSPDAAPWLLIAATSHADSGIFANVSFIQRLHTAGGKAPALGESKAGDEVRVPYTADYVFYGPGATTQPAKP